MEFADFMKNPTKTILNQMFDRYKQKGKELIQLAKMA
jgi:hypothetical protein